MRRRHLAPILAVTLAFAACGGDDDDSSDEASDDTTEESVSSDYPDVVGQSLDDATATLEEAGFTIRVVREDGEDLAGTMDFVENRVNVAVETGDDGTQTVTEIVSTG